MKKKDNQSIGLFQRRTGKGNRTGFFQQSFTVNFNDTLSNK